MLGTVPQVPRVLIVEDNEAFASTLAAALRVLDTAEVRTLRPEGTAPEVLGAILQWRADVVVLDVDLQQWWSGATLCAPLASCGTRVIVATAAPALVPADCAVDVYDKTQPWAELMAMVDRALPKPVTR